MKRSVGVAAVLVLGILLPAWTAAHAGTTGPDDPIYPILREAELTGGSLPVRGVTLRRDALELSLEEGALHLAAPAQGRAWLGVFQGKGRLRLTPATTVERDHLRLLTGQASLEAFEESFEEAVLVWTDGTGEELGVSKAAPGAAPGSAKSKPEKLRKLMREWLGTELELRILTELYSPRAAGLFVARVEGRDHPELLYVHDPRGAAPGLSAAEESGLYNADEQKGGWWYLAHTLAEEAAGQSAHAPRLRFEALRHDIETAIDKKEKLQSTARVRLRAPDGGSRLVNFGLQGKLRVSSAWLLPRRAALPWIQAEDEEEALGVAVLLPEAPAAGQELEIELAHAGEGVVEQLDKDRFWVGERTVWYPNPGPFQDEALYSLRFCVPKGFELIAVGRRVSSETRGGQDCSAWSSEVPLLVAGFNFGRFKKKEQQDPDSGLLLEMYTNPGRTSAEADRALVDAVNSVRVFTAYFGALPYSRVAVTEQPSGSFGQAWPTLVYLPWIALLDGPTRRHGGGLRLDSMSAFPQTVGAHEMAHQWWGHTVGHRSYRDNWLSEGFAEFSAGLWLEVTEGADRADLFWKDVRKNVVGETIYDQVPYKAGPLTLGHRLSTHRSKGASELMYSKGAYVVHMLRLMLQSPRGEDQAFIAMMKDYAGSFRNRLATAADFQAVVERHMSAEMDVEGNRRMDWFFRQWVHGTEVPAAYVLQTQTEPAGAGKLRLRGTLRQTGVSEGFRMLVPIYLELDKGKLVRIGRTLCKGTTPAELDVVLPVPKVRKVLVNAHLDVLSVE